MQPVSNMTHLLIMRLRGRESESELERRGIYIDVKETGAQIHREREREGLADK